jgi:hypothetical protein
VRAGIAQVNQAIAQMDQVTQQNAGRRRRMFRQLAVGADRRCNRRGPPVNFGCVKIFL